MAERPYSRRSGLVLGFHGTDLSVAHDVVLGRRDLQPSVNSWDWIGHGIYFWEHSPSRAIEFAQSASKRRGSTIKIPAVLGAIIDLGNCLDLLDYENLGIVKESYNSLGSTPELMYLQNKPSLRGDSNQLLLRDLDCAVIEKLHETMSNGHAIPFDSVKAVFWEGPLLYPNAGFREKDHIQICIRNPNCIKGFFIPRTHQRISR